MFIKTYHRSMSQNIDPAPKATNFEYFLVGWLILLSGSPAIHLVPGATYITATLALFYVLGKRKVFYLKEILPSLLFFSIIFLCQYYTLKYLPIKYPLGIFVMLISGSFIYSRLGVKFRYVYLDVIFFFSIISIFFWLLQQLLGSTFDLFGIENVRNIVIWSVRHDPYNLSKLEFRNNGPVWEPGAFSGYIILLGLLFIGDLKLVWKTHKNKFIVILCALLTTFSTTGYILLLLIILYLTLSRYKKSMIGLFILIPSILIFSYLIFFKLDFIGNKILTEYQTAAESDGTTFSNTRLGSLFFDMHYIEKHPFFGNGMDPKTRWSDNTDLYLRSINGENLGYGNGFSGYLASMGGVSLLFILINIFLAFKKYIGILGSVYVITLFIVLLQGENFLNYPMLLCLYFIKLPKYS